MNTAIVERKARIAALALALVLPIALFSTAAPVAADEPYELVSSAPLMGDDRYVVASAYYEGKIYLAGGYDSAGWPVLDTTLIYDVETGETTYGPSMPSGTDAPFNAQMPDGRLFVIGGFNATLSVQVFDPAVEEWTVTDNPTPIDMAWGSATVGHDGLIYCFGSYNAMNSTLIYDPESDSWSYGADIPTPVRASTAVTNDDGLIYVMGGADQYLTIQDVVQVYDPQADTWSSGASMPLAVSHAVSAVARNGFIYVFGGSTGAFSDSPTVATLQRYDPAADSWTDLGAYLSNNRGGYPGIATDANGRIFVLGGFDGTFAQVSVDVFLMSTVSDPYQIQIVSPAEGAVVSGVVCVDVALVNSFGMWAGAVDFIVDGVLLETQSMGDWWSFSWDTTGLEDGSEHELLVRAYYWDLTTVEDTVTVTVSTMTVEELIADLESQIADLQAQLDALAEDVNDTDTAHAEEIAALQDELASLRDSLEQLTGDVDETQTSVDDKLSVTMGYALLGLFVLVLVLLLVMIFMGRKRASPPPAP